MTLRSQAISSGFYRACLKRSRIPYSRQTILVQSRTNTQASSLHRSGSSTADVQIFDIFDAPSRLGESSKLLGLPSSNTKQSPSPSPDRTNHRHSIGDATPTPTQSKHSVPSTPEVMTFDGPAGSRRVYSTRIGATYRQSSRSTAAREAGIEAASSLPPPLVFDGPSGFRPYYASSSSNLNGAAQGAGFNTSVSWLVG